MLYAQVIVKQRTQVQELTYALSAQIVPYVKVGSLVLVPLRRKEVKGVVVGFSRSVPKEIKGSIREIIKLDKNTDVFSAAQIEVIHSLATYYAAPLAEVAFHALQTPQTSGKGLSFREGFKPLIISGAWSQRCQAYQQILQKTTGRVLIIFAQHTFAQSFYQSLSAEQSAYILYYIRGVSQRKLVTAVRRPEIRAMIGTLGDIFFPLQAGDTIVVDQPYHIGAKSQSRPFMSARQIALIRGEVEGLRVVLGDSVISPADLLAVKEKKFRLTTAKSTSRELTIVDRRGQQDAIAPSVLSEIEQVVNLRQKILVLVMARGWASALVCRECGHIFTCQNCNRTPGVQGKKLRCCYCATEIETPTTCPSCRSTDLKPIGGGVSAITKLLSDKFTATKVQELSSDVPALDPKSGITVATEKIFSFPSSSFDQTFILNADRLLSGTHLDGAWRLLGYLIELQSISSGIVVQTFFPDSIVWSSAATGNVRPFFAQELANRQQLNLPPYGAVVAVRGSANTTAKLFSQAEEITNEALKILPVADISFPEVDDRSGSLYHGHFTIYLPKPPQNSLKTKLASVLTPSWHLDID
ncbi:MAG: hypothetical protein Q8Q05_01285 [bacterium]|nr:hypothetical protein [bacterium]